MKNFINLWISKICLLVILLLWGPLSSMALASDPKLTSQRYKNLPAEEKQKVLAVFQDLYKRKRSDRLCKLGNLFIAAGPDPGLNRKELKSWKPAIKFPKRVVCPNNSHKFCSKWIYHFFWGGPAEGLDSVSVSLPSNLNLIKVTPGYGVKSFVKDSAGNQKPLGKSNFETVWIDFEVDPGANQIEVSFITPLAKPGKASAGGISSSGLRKFCKIAGAGIRNVKPLGSSSNIQCIPPKKGDIVGFKIRKDPDGTLDIETGLRFFIKKGTKVPFQGCDGSDEIQPLVVESAFTTCGSSKGGSLCLIKKPKKPDGAQTFSIGAGQHGEAGLICVDLQNAKPLGCDTTGKDIDHPCSTFHCSKGGCNGTAYACNPWP